MCPSQETRIQVWALPVELYYLIILFLDVKDVFTLRKTCKYFSAITQERSLWWMMFAHLRARQALPCSRSEFATMSSGRTERVLFTASRVDASFLQLRERIAHHIPAVKQEYSSTNTSTCSWRVLTFISDRFLLSVDDTAVIIWGTAAPASSSSTDMCTPWARFTLSKFLGHVECHSTLYFAVSRVHADYQSVVVYSVPLPSSESDNSDHGCLHREAEFPLHETEILKHMDPKQGRALLYMPPTSINVLEWRDGNKRSTLSIQIDEPDQPWNGITCLRFCGLYVLCFRVRSVEAYPIPTDTTPANPLPVLRHRFGPVCFRMVSLSQVRTSHSPSENGDVYTVFMLTNDVYQGMFHYCIRVITGAVPAMSVHVLAKGSICSPDPLPLIPGTDVRYTLDDIIRRMFVPTWSLGSAGLRGVWVDRQRGSIDRRVVAFTTHPSRLRGKGSISGKDASDEAPTMDGKVVHVVSSYDLRDDITICAVSEWTGRIALGSRVGAISLL